MKPTNDKTGKTTQLDSQWTGMRIAFDLDEKNKMRAVNTGMQLYAQAVLWFHKLNLFRAGEVRFFYDQTPTENMLSDHKQMLEVLITEAQEIARRIRVNGQMVTRENGFTVEDLEAAIQELETTKIQWHSGMSSKERNEILEKVFGG